MSSEIGRHGAVCMMLLAAVGLLGTPAASAAPAGGSQKLEAPVEVLSESEERSFGLPASGARQQWVEVVAEERVDTSVDADGRRVTTTGMYREFALAPQGAGVSTMAETAAAGCKVSHYHSGPYRAWSSIVNHYVPQAYAWAETSSGCKALTVIYLNMREDQFLNYNPTVASANGKSLPGAGRKTVKVSYHGLKKCETYWTTAFGWKSDLVKVCP